MNSPSVRAAILILGATAASAFGQGSEVERLNQAMREAERQYQLLSSPAMTVGERALLEYGGLVNFSFLAIDSIGQETHILRLTDSMLFARLNIDGAHEFYGRTRFTYLDWNTGDDFDDRGDRLVEPLADRWWYSYNHKRAIESTEGVTPDFNITAKVGRQFVNWASGLVFSDQLYAGRGTVQFGDLEVEWLAGVTPGSTVLDFDSSRRSFDRDTERGFYGGKIAYTGIRNHKPYFYAIHQHDYNDEDFEVIMVGMTPVPTKFNYDSTYWAVGSTGTIIPRLLYTAEFIYETGEGLSSSITSTAPLMAIPQTEEDVEAWAATLELTYLMRDENLTRLEFQTIIASGDDDRDLDTSNTFGGNRSGTDDKAFNAFGFAKTGLSFAAPISNLILVRGGASTFPFRTNELFKNMQVGIDLLWFNKFDADAPLDEPTTDDHYLGFETDFFLAWRITSDVAVNIRYGVFFPGTAIDGDNDPRHFVLTGITYSF